MHFDSGVFTFLTARAMQLVSKLLLIFAIGFAGLMSPALAQQHKGINFQAFLKSPSNTYPNATGLTATVQILTADNCVLREEQHSNVNITNGYVYLVVGGPNATASGGYNPSTVLSLPETFNNSVVRSGLTCVNGDNSVALSNQTYTPALTHGRKMRLRMNIPSEGLVVADFNMRSVPFAVNSEMLEGKTTTDFIQVDATKKVTQTNLNNFFSDSNFANINSILSGTYNAPTATSSVTATNVSGTVAIANGGTGATTRAGAVNALLPSQATQAGKYLTTDGTNVSWSTVASGASGNAGGDLTGTYPNPTLTTSGVTAGTYGATNKTINTIQVDAKGRIANITDSLISLNGNQITAGTIGTGFGGTGLSTLGTADQILGMNAAASGYEFKTISAGAGISISHAANSITVTATGGGGGVSSVTSANADIGVANTTTTPVLTLNSGTAANQIVKLNALAELPAVSGVNLTNVNAVQIQGRGIDITAPLDGQVLLWDNGVSTWKPQYVRMQDVRNAWGGTQMIPSAACATNEAMVWSVVTDRFSCQAIALSASAISGTLAVANGGTGATTTTAAFNALAPSQTLNGGKFLSTDGTNTSWATIFGGALSDLTGATANNTLANADFIQTWNWDTLTTGTGMTMAAGGNSITSGGVLTLTNSRDNAASVGNVLTVNASGVSNAAVPLMINNAGTGLSFRVNDDGTSTDLTPFVIDNSGNVGIGTSSPASKLEIQGLIGSTVKIVDGNQGSGKVLTSDANGNASWQNSTSPPDSEPIYKVKVATTQNIVLSGTQTIDSVVLSAGDRVLVKNQTTPAQNGVYVVGAGAWTRASDMDTWNEVVGYKAQVTEGSLWGGFSFTSVSPAAGTLETNSIMWSTEGSSTNWGNVGFGGDVLTSITAGADNNTGFGNWALVYNTTGDDNSALGTSALLANTIGSRNTAIGSLTLYSNTTGNSNTGVGANSLIFNDTGSSNTGIGYSTLRSNSTGSNNIALGEQALYSNTVGSKNTALGGQALYPNVALSESTAIGYFSMRYANSTATAANSNNTAVGAYSLQGSITPATNTGIRNTAVGHSALKNLVSGSSNIGLGFNAGLSITTGNSNVVIGSNSGATIATSSNNILLSDGAGNERMRIISSGNVGIANSLPAVLLHVGSATVATGVAVANFQNIDGTCTITPAAAGSGIACSSDENLKENFKDVPGEYALGQILKLQAVTYNFKTSSPENRHTGYKAQQVRKIAPEFVRQNDDGFLQVYYDAFIPWITESIKSIFNRITSMDAETAQLKARVEKAEKESSAMKAYLCDKDPSAPFCQ